MFSRLITGRKRDQFESVLFLVTSRDQHISLVGVLINCNSDFHEEL